MTITMRTTQEARTQGEESPICFFPTVARPDMQSITFDSQVVHKLTAIPDARDAGVHLLLAGLWALALRRYAEVDTARFEVSTSTVASKTASGATRQIYCITMSPSDPVSTLLDINKWDIRPVRQNDGESFNTGVYVVDDHNAGRCVLDVEFHDINLLLQSDRTSAELSLVYRSSAMGGTYARHLADGLAQAIVSISEDPNQSIRELDFCCPIQKAQVMAWHKAPIIQQDRSFLFEYINRNATVHGDTLAVDSWDGQFSYRELDDLSTHMAAWLQEQGIGPGDLVPVCFEKTKWAIVAMLAINKTGAAFAPLDPAYPRGRLDTIIQKTQARVALVSPRTESILRPLGLAVLVISGCPPQSRRYTAPTSALAPAYCFFTSGSTGDPKGCEVSHIAFASIATHASSLCLSQQSRSLQFASFCFGASLLEIWCTLIACGTLCIPSDHDRLNSVGEFMTKMRVNWAFITPTVLASISPDNYKDLHLFIAGEPIGERDIRTWAPRARLFQAYGLTEWAGIFAVSRQIRTPEDRRSIGYPVNARAWIVDPVDHQKLAPIGAVGELVIEGPSLAQGYRGDPERTAAVFFQRPPWLALTKGDGSTSRVYKTGDLVRYAEDGSLVYVRRKDNQVKIHGQRLEIGEVEYQVRQLFPRAKMVIVMVHEPSGAGSYQRNLIALTVHPAKNGATGASQGELGFVAVDQEYRSQVEHVKDGLRARLPAFMIPQLFLPLSQIPTTITGKADRRSLCRDINKLSYAQLHDLTTPGVMTRAARGEAEEVIHAAVCDVLALAPERFGMDDDFFHLGGNSASAMKLTASARRRGLRLTIRDVFSHPVLADLASAAALSNGYEGPAVRTMQLLQPESVSELRRLAVSQCGLPENCIEDIFPSTALQEGLIAMTARDPSLYRARVICKLRSNVRISTLKAAWERVVQMNDILRTRFIVSPSHGTLQVVCRAPVSWVQTQNLQDCIQQSDELTHRAGDNLVHFYIVPDKEDRDSVSAFVFVAHHALCDQWSIRLLLDQLTAAYGHRNIPRNRFTAFIRYLSKRKSEFKEYWTRQFQGLEAVAFPPLPSPGYTPVASEQLGYGMDLLGNSNTQVTTANYIKLAWAVVISCNTGVNDTVFGMTVNGRGAAVDGVGEMTGPTIATIPQRIKLLPEQTVRGALVEIQAHALEVIPYEQAGLQNIQHYSPEARSACMFQSQLIIQPCPASPPDLFETCDFAVTHTGGFSAYGLSVECQMTHDDRRCEVTATFDPGMISRERVQRLVQHLELVLQEIMSDSTRKVGGLPRMSRQDWDKIQRWNGNPPSISRQCVHDIIHERYLDDPSACAVAAPDGDLSYAELMQAANAVAATLMTRGVEPGGYIPVLFEKCKWSPVAMLGVLKAGAAFVLLDPSYPPQRLLAICEGVKSNIILCSNSMRKRAASLAPTAIAVDDAACQADVPSATLPVVSPVDPAYVVFTSGSTGTPKGAIIDHQSYCSSAVAHNAAHCVDRDSRVLQYASYAFDVSIMETLSTLMAGGCVCILSDSERRDHFADSVQRLAVTHAFLTPSTARLLMQRELPSLRVLVLGGEAMSPADCSYWMKRVRLMNEYGIAECAVASIIREISDVGQRNIGFPMGVTAWIVDQNDHETPVAIGAVGELLLEGPSVGRGYLDNPEATRRAFMDQPGWLRAVRDGKPSRVYKTGDLVQYNEDGSLNFIGRTDSQIKIHGQRFELEEVEHHLRQIDEVQEVVAVVAALLDRPKQQYLVAFVVPRGRKSFCVDSVNALVAQPTEDFHRLAGAIQSKLHSILPAYMVPSIYLPVRRMPKASSDKVDRCRLKEEVGKWSWSDLQAYSVSKTARRAPSTGVEQDLQQVWSQILGIPLDSIGVEDSFFHLGGDSITAMQVIAEARSLGLDHSIQDINQLKSITAIAGKIGVRASSLAHPTVQDEVTGELFGLTPIQEFFFEMYPEGTSRFNQNILVHFQRPVTASDVERAAVRLVQNHAILRARYSRQKDGSWKQFHAGYTRQCFHFRVHRVNSSQEMRRIIDQSQTSLDPEEGPVFAVDLFEHGGEQSLFMIGHHLVLDLVSWRIILADMEAMILDPQHEPQRTLSFQTWARLQAEYGASHLEPPPARQLNSIDEHSMRKFWGAEHNANTVGDSRTTLVRLDEPLTTTLFGPTSQALDVEPVELLHAAILCSFVRTFPQRVAPCIFGEAHGRETWDASIDVTRTVGWFTTLWPVVAQVSPSDSLTTAVRTVRQARRAMAMHGWKHFTSMYHNTTNERCSAGTRPLEITFNYAGKFQQVEQDGALFRMEPMAEQSLFDGAGELGRWAMLEINSVILNGMLEFHVTYNRGIDEARVLTPWMENLVQCLEDLARGNELVGDDGKRGGKYSAMSCSTDGGYEFNSIGTGLV